MTTDEGGFVSSALRVCTLLESPACSPDTPEATEMHAGRAALGVRGTEFVVRADGGERGRRARDAALAGRPPALVGCAAQS